MTAIDVLMERRREIVENTADRRGVIEAQQRAITKSEWTIEEMRRELDDIDAALAKLDPDNYAVAPHSETLLGKVNRDDL